MTPAEFRAALEAAGLRQVDFARLLAQLSGQPANAGTVNRWAKGRRAVPPSVIAILALWRMVPRAKQHKIMEFIAAFEAYHARRRRLSPD